MQGLSTKTGKLKDLFVSFSACFRPITETAVSFRELEVWKVGKKFAENHFPTLPNFHGKSRKLHFNRKVRLKKMRDFKDNVSMVIS